MATIDQTMVHVDLCPELSRELLGPGANYKIGSSCMPNMYDILLQLLANNLIICLFAPLYIYR